MKQTYVSVEVNNYISPTFLVVLSAFHLLRELQRLLSSSIIMIEYRSIFGKFFCSKWFEFVQLCEYINMSINSYSGCY